MKISAKTKLCMIIGDPIEHSLSPAMHNAGYSALGIDHEFVFVACRVDIQHIQKSVDAVRMMGIRGLTCTMPHKIHVMPYLDEIDSIAQKIGAVNTVVNQDGYLKGYNTDWLGVVKPLEHLLGEMGHAPSVQQSSLKGKKVALIGAGGAARAAAYGIASRGAKLTIFNRSFDKAQDLAREFSADALPLTDIEPLINADIIFNATSLGMGEHVGLSPIPKKAIKKHHIVFDAVYEPHMTQLLLDAQDQGATIIHGSEMLLYQGVAQFELYTSHKAPIEAMREALNIISIKQ